MHNKSLIKIKNLDIIFGDKKSEALILLDNGFNREDIKQKTGAILGVKNINLSIQEGEILVLMGLSGSGKSTLVRAINGLNSITRGTVNVLGYDLEKCNKKSLRDLRQKHIAMVFQSFALFSWRTVLDNAAFGLELCGLRKEKRYEIALKALSQVGLSSWVKHYPKELSGGMQQRVGLARALATNADILLMDEPFSALDPLIKSHLQDELLALQKKFHKTIVFVTHDFSEAIKIGSRLAILKDGEIVQEGKPEEILYNPKTPHVIEFVKEVKRIY